MPTASYRLKEIKVRSNDGTTVAEVLWQAEFTDSEGVLHWGEVWYSITPSSEWSPAAAALLAKATTSEEILAAVRVDANRCIADLENPNHPAGSRLFVTPTHVLPVAMTFDDSGKVAEVITAQDEAAATVAAALARQAQTTTTE